MSNDISGVLSRWPFDEDSELQVRRVEGIHGNPALQVRIDLGLLQMETSGRPDGQKPYGCDSLLEYHRVQAETHRDRHGWYEGYELNSAQCAAVRQEAHQYYRRRIAFMALQDYSAAVADANHGLELLDLLKAFARNREDWLAAEQDRPSLVSQRVECFTLQHLAREDVRAALLEVERGARQLREVFAEADRLDELEESAELAALDELRRKLDARYQVTHRRRLQILLDEAMQREDPDAAATLRSQLRDLDIEA